jgi:hypothetical protein
MNPIGSTGMACGVARLLFVALVALFPAAAGAVEVQPPAGRTDTAGAQWRNTVQADLLTRLNPDGVLVSVGVYRRPWPQPRGEIFWMPAETLWSLNRPRVYGRAGANLQDRNRSGELFVTFGIGFDYDL